MMRMRAVISPSVLLFLLCASLTTAFWYDPSCPKNTSGCHCVASRLRGGGDKCCCVGQDVLVIPANLSTNMDTLLMSEVGIKTITATDLLHYPLLEQIDISNAKQLTFIEAKAFHHLAKLRKLTVTNNGLERMPNLRMTDRHHMPMQSIDFSYNKIQNLSSGQIHRVYTKSLRLDNNKLREIGDHAFNKCKFVDLNLSHNRNLKTMSKSAFEGILVIHNLDLSDTSISELPTEGIKELKSIAIEKTESLKQLPSILAFTNLQEARFTHPFHCCLFKHAKRETALSNLEYTKNWAEMQTMYCGKGAKVINQVVGNKLESRRRRRRQATVKPSTPQASAAFSIIDYYLDRWGAYENDTQTDSEEIVEEDVPGHSEGTVYNCADDNEGIYRYYENITCTPVPNALNPCEDVVGYPFLRVAIWLVWILAILGNIGVWIVLVVVRHPRMKVHYFFMMNLALADLLTGVYLAMLAIQDIKTSGEYYNHAVEWQYGMGCKVAGFISVFASELSIITMFLISFEIWYNTKYIFYGKRLQQRTAWIAMGLGYIYSIMMATLPLFEVSSYSQTSICLPLDIRSTVDRGYIVSGLIFNVIAFVGMATNYGMIYCTVNGSASPSTRPEDIQVAKKMAFLIGTDFLCWCPTIFFGLTAALKMPLISISVAKIFLVLFYPINAFTNPFLYVFFTKIIRTDIRNIARRSSIYKYITEHRHSKEPTSKSTTLNRYYYNSAPPGSERRQRHPSVATFLQVTGSTSLGSTPRGSNCSTNARSSAPSLETLKVDQNQLSNGASPRLTPRVSFNDEVIIDKVDQQQPITSPKRKSSTVKSMRVSAAPQMSDISEMSDINSHSSDDHHAPLSPADRVLKSLVDATSFSNGTTIRKPKVDARPLVSILAHGGRRKRVSDDDGDGRAPVDVDDDWWRRHATWSATSSDRQSSLASSGFGSMRADSESSELSQKLDSADPARVPMLSLRQTAHTSIDRCSISPSIESGYSGTPDAADNRKMNAQNSLYTGRTTPILTVSDFSDGINDVAASWV